MDLGIFISLIIWYILAVICGFFLLWWQLSGKFLNFCILFYSIQKDVGHMPNYIKTRRFFNFLAVLFCCSGLAMLMLSLIYIRFPDAIPLTYMALFRRFLYIPWFPLFRYIGMVIANWLSVLSVVTFTFHYMCTWLVYLEFKDFNQRLSLNLSSENLIQFCIQHRKIEKLVDHLNSMFSVFTCIAYGLSIPFMVVVLYSQLSITGSIGLIQIFCQSSLLILAVMEMMMLSLMPSILHEEVGE